MFILIGLIILIVGGFIAYVIVSHQKELKNKSEINQLKHLLDTYSEEEIRELKDRLLETAKRNNELQETLSERLEIISKLKDRVAAAEKKQAVDKIQEERIISLENQITQYEEHLKDLQTQIEYSSDSLKKRVIEKDEVVNQIAAMTEKLECIWNEINAAAEHKEGIDREIDDLYFKLAQLQQSHAEAVGRMYMENNGERG